MSAVEFKFNRRLMPDLPKSPRHPSADAVSNAAADNAYPITSVSMYFSFSEEDTEAISSVTESWKSPSSTSGTPKSGHGFPTPQYPGAASAFLWYKYRSGWSPRFQSRQFSISFMGCLGSRARACVDNPDDRDIHLGSQ